MSARRRRGTAAELRGAQGVTVTSHSKAVVGPPAKLKDEHGPMTEMRFVGTEQPGGSQPYPAWSELSQCCAGAPVVGTSTDVDETTW